MESESTSKELGQRLEEIQLLALNTVQTDLKLEKQWRQLLQVHS